MSSPSVPLVATYRLQLRSGVTLDQVREEWLDVLAELGVSHLYLSPVFAAAAGSTHGYDVVDPTRVDDAIGGDEAFDALADAAHRLGLGVVVDLVPNHVATDHDHNAAWWDLLRNGPASPSAELFDLDWSPPERRLRGRLLLPVLPDHYGRELEAGAFRLEVVRGEPRLWHPSVHAPLELSSLAPLLADAAAASGDTDLAALADEAAHLPSWTLPFAEGALEDRRACEPELRARLETLLDGSGCRAAVQARLDAVTADVEALDVVLGAQPYRLARWQVASEDLGYRRFFDVNTLVGVRVDRAPVFDLTHSLVRRWVDERRVDGLRIDHVDGLRWPTTYLEQLRELAPDQWIVVEKILEGAEELPSWPIDGTTGYEVAELIDRLDLDDAGRPHLDALARSVGGATDVDATVHDAKQTVLDELLSADLNRLTDLLLTVCEERRRFRDVTRRELHRALRSVLSSFGVYRTYLRPGSPVPPADREHVRTALTAAAADVSDVDPEIFELLALLLTDENVDRSEREWDLVARFQQLCSPTMAKGAEDTAWFRLPSLVSRCEVGADPSAWEVGLDEFHRAMARRQERWPRAMTTATTHDTKRSADVRATLAVVSQTAEEWATIATAWLRDHASDAPDPVIAAQLLQTMVGAWPIDGERLATHALKLAREAKLRTSWLRPDHGFEQALDEFVRRTVDDPATVDLVEGWHERHRTAVEATILAHAALTLTVPGVPDLYQGTEDRFLRLTDPDNREPADPARLRSRLQELRTGDPAGLTKVALTQAALALRRRHPEAFDERGSYVPVWASGPRSDHAVAFRRGDDVLVITARRVIGVADGWGGTSIELPEGAWRPTLTGGAVGGRADLDDLLGGEPVALLERIR